MGAKLKVELDGVGMMGVNRKKVLSFVKQAFFAKPCIDTNTNDDSFSRYHTEPNGKGLFIVTIPVSVPVDYNASCATEMTILPL